MSQIDAALPKSYDFHQVEAKWIAAWEESGIYRYNPESDAAKAGRTFSIDTPPPYVSAAHLHVGHAMSYSQAEFVIRYKRMRGYEVFYPMGFDDNGLPTERYVEKKYKVHKGNTSRKDFIDLCLQETRAGAKVYQALWRSLGLSVDWRMTYSTIAPRATEHAQRSFLELAQEGRIERRADPILWDPRMQTALAQADVEPGPEINRPMHKLRFDRAGEGEPGLIETTRPELVTACVALACHPDDERFAATPDVRFKVPLTELRADGSTAAHRTVPLIYDESVDPEFGTGLMMVCTFGDQEDIIKWRTHKLDLFMVIGSDGKMDTPELPSLHGKRVHVLAKRSKLPEARLAAKELLEEHGYLLGVSDNISRAAVSERSGTPIEIQVVPQWFVRLLDLKEQLIARGRELRWHPAHMRDRYEHWVGGLKWDWNISRQRFYGVPLPVWYRQDTGAAVLPAVSDLPIDPLVDAPPASVLAQVPEGVELKAEEDVMDTWMTSSITPLINANWAYWDKPSPHPDDVAFQPRPEIFPMGVRVQAFEIIRTWLFYSVAKAHMHNNSLPWRDVMISGWGLDKQGKKMSKRLGNFVDPAGVIEKYSADSLRYWAAGATLGHDLRYLENDVKGGKRLLTKLWNSTRFALMSIGSYDPSSSAAEAPTAADRWIRGRIIEAAQQATASFEGYEYNKALRATEQLFWRDWCDNYLEIVKDRFRNPDQWQPEQVEAARATIFFGTWTLLRLFAPVLPFITEELYQAALRPAMGADAPESLHCAPWPVDEQTGGVDVFGGEVDAEGLRLGGVLIDLVAAVRQLKTEGRLGLGRPLEAIYLSGDDRADVEAVADDWRAAARAAVLSWEAPSEAHAEAVPRHQVGDRALKIGIAPAPKSPKPPKPAKA